jgi:hypothetical protein
MRNDEQRYPFTAKRVTVTEVRGYVEATDAASARQMLESNRGVIEVEHVGPIDSQEFSEIRVTDEPLGEDPW